MGITLSKTLIDYDLDSGHKLLLLGIVIVMLMFLAVQSTIIEQANVKILLTENLNDNELYKFIKDFRKESIIKITLAILSVIYVVIAILFIIPNIDIGNISAFGIIVFGLSIVVSLTFIMLFSLYFAVYALTIKGIKATRNIKGNIDKHFKNKLEK